MSRRWRSMLQDIVDEFGGGRIEHTPGGHLALRLARGGAVYVAATPSDHRAIKNIRRDVRRVAGGRTNDTIRSA